MRAIFIALFAAVCAPAGYGVTTVTYPVGASAFWPGTINWVPISTYDGVDSSLDATVDFVGDASNPALFYAKTTDYVFSACAWPRPPTPPRRVIPICFSSIFRATA